MSYFTIQRGSKSYILTNRFTSISISRSGDFLSIVGESGSKYFASNYGLECRMPGKFFLKKMEIQSPKHKVGPRDQIDLSGLSLVSQFYCWKIQLSLLQFDKATPNGSGTIDSNARTATEIVFPRELSGGQKQSSHR
jgi:ABC-type lipoprotein export system ATPase subunit